MAYDRDYLMAQMACGAYKDDNGKFPRQIEGWDAIPRVDEQSGFAAVAYQNKTTGEIIVAFRGTDGLWNDKSANSVIAGNRLDNHWDTQFARGLEFIRDLKQQYPHADMSVTGHSLGGALAQVSAQAYGLKGVTFDPGGADNIIQSDGFKQSMKNLGLPPNGVGVPSSFNNYLVNESKVSHLSGDHVGKTTPVSGIANSSPSLVQNKKDLDDAWFPNSGQNLAKQGRDQLNRHSMDRIEDVFQDAARTGRLNQIGNLDSPLHMASLESKPAIDPSALTKQAGLEDAVRVAQSIFPTTPDASLALKELELQRRELALEKQEIALKNRELELRSQTLDQKEERLAEWTRQVYAREQKLEVAEAKLQHPSAAQAPAFVPNAQMQRNLQVLGEKLTEPLRAQGFSDEEIRNSCIAMACRIEKLPGSNREIHYVRVVEERGNIEALVNPYSPHVPLEQARRQTPEQSIADLQMHQQQRQQQGQQRSGPSLG